MRRVLYFVLLLTACASQSGPIQEPSRATASLEGQDSNLDRLIADVNAALESGVLPNSAFCQSYWDKDTLSICEQLPWKYALNLSPGIHAKFPIGDGQTGFLDFVNLSYKCGGKKCLLGLDLLEPWQKLSEKWTHARIFSGDLVSAKPLDTNSVKMYSQQVTDWLKKIASVFSIKTNKEHSIFFLNDQVTATTIGFQFSPIVSGGARGDYLVFVGQSLPPSWLLHELVHSYTAYPGEWWEGPDHFVHAILNEGLAVSLQLQEIWSDPLPPTEVGNLFCNDLQVASKNLNGKILRLFDNNEFRIFDQGGYHPSYLVGASVISSLRKRMGISKLRRFWNRIGKIHDPVKAANFLNRTVSEKQLASELKDYFQQLAMEIRAHTGVSCPL